MTIAAIEAWLIARIKTIFGATLKQVDSLPATLDAAALERIFASTPGVFVIFTGGKPNPAGATNASMLGRWIFLAATGHAGKEVTRRHGDAREIGAYQIIDRLVPMVHGNVVPGAGSLAFAGVSNLFGDATDLKGVTVYGVDFDLPMEFDPNDFGGSDSLADFLHFKDTVSPTEGDGGIPAHDAVELPAP